MLFLNPLRSMYSRRIFELEILAMNMGRSLSTILELISTIDPEKTPIEDTLN